VDTSHISAIVHKEVIPMEYKTIDKVLTRYEQLLDKKRAKKQVGIERR
jgi:hypothetical protein